MTDVYRMNEVMNKVTENNIKHLSIIDSRVSTFVHAHTVLKLYLSFFSYYVLCRLFLWQGRCRHFSTEMCSHPAHFQAQKPADQSSPWLYFPNMDLFPSKYQFPTGLLTLSLRLGNIISANVYWVPSTMPGRHSAKHLPNTSPFNSPNHPIREALLLMSFYIWKKTETVRRLFIRLAIGKLLCPPY